MSLNLALVVSGDASGAKAAVDQTTVGVKALGTEARQTSAAMVAANDATASSARRATEAMTVQAATQRQLQQSIQSMVAAAQPTGDASYRQRAADIDAYGAALDRTRARYDPLFAAQMRHKAAVEAIDQAERVGAISASLATDARLKETAALNSQISALNGVAAAQKNAAQAMVNRVTIVPDRGADIAAYGAELDRLRARYDPLFVAQQKYQAEIETINQAERTGAISASLATDARLKETAALNSQISALNGVAAAQKNAAQAMVSRATIVPDRGSDIEAYGQSLDRLRARFNPTFAAVTQYKEAVLEARQAERIGAISTDEMTAAIGRQRTAALQSIAAIKGRQSVNGSGNAFASMNATSQFQDIAVTAAMGQSPMTIALQQGTQLGMAMQMQMGDKGAMGVVKGLGSAFMGLLSPINLVAIGLTGAAALAIQYFSSGAEKSKALDDSLNKNVDAIKALTDAYHMAGVSADELQRKSIAASEAGERRSEKELEAQIRLEQKRFTANTKPTDLMTFGMLGDNSADVAPEFAAFTDPIRALRKEIDAQAKGEGKANFDAFFQQIDQIANTGPGAFHGFVDELVRSTGVKVETYSDIRDRLYEMGGAARQAAQQLELVLEVQRKIDQENTRQGLQDNRALGRYVGARNIQDSRAQEQFEASQQMERARTNAERLAAVEREARAKFPSQADEGGGRDARVERARQGELQRQQMELKDAQDQRRRSLDQTLASAKLDVDLVGQTTSAVEGLRLAAQLEAQVREEAAIKGTKADEAEIASIHQKAIEYGKLRALQEARDTIHGQEQDLEIQRAELALVGASRLEHDRVIATLKTEQEIRKLGIDVYGQEAEAMRANTAAAAALADATARASLQKQLQFDREQMFRSPTEQNVASTMQGAGLDYDPNSAIAQQIRYNEQLKTTKAAWEDIFSTVDDGIDGISDALFSGGSIEDSLKKAGQQLAKTMFDMAATNPLKNWLSGANANTIADLGIFGSGASSGKGGGFGGVLGQMLGAQKAVASMQVQAASVFINGSPLGVPGLGGLGSLLSPAANSNIAGPNTPETAAKLLAGLGSPLGFGTDSTATNSIAKAASGGGVAGQVWNFFASKGLKDFQIAGILGNVKAESAFNPLAIGDGGNAFGLFQHNDRAPALFNAIGGRSNLGDVQAQLGFAWKELQGSESQALKALLASKDVRGATSAFAGFERPQGFSWANPEGAHNFVGRLSGAQEALSRFGGTATSATSALTGSTSAMSSLASSTGTAAKGLDIFGNGAGKLGSALGQFPAAPGGGGGGFGGLFGMIGGLFGLGGGASIASMNAISPAATAAILGGGGGLYANGAAFRNGNVVPFAKGDVFSSPTYFPMSAGRTGVLGEDGEEAIMPLRRGPDGRLGVVNHQPIRAPRGANGNAAGGGSSGGLTRGHIEGIVSAISSKLKLNANIINLNDGSDIKRWMMSEDGHATVAVVNKRLGG